MDHEFDVGVEDRAVGCGGLVVESPASEHEDTSSNLTGVGYLIMITIAKQCMGKHCEPATA
jgi:hypothetical protein